MVMVLIVHLHLPWVLLNFILLLILVVLCTLSDCYDPLDPNGNISITFDIYQRTQDGYLARVTLENYYEYRHVDKPGWQLGWQWANDEVIWSIKGAVATDQGNCSSYTSQLPHSCKKDPLIVDLPADVSPESRSEHCCNGGILSARAIDPFSSFTLFELEVRNLGQYPLGQAPNNLTLLAPGPGYTCSPLLQTDPTVISSFNGQRQVPALRTWKSACTYSNFMANKSPICCVSLSTFYNPMITPCPDCSCGCSEADKASKSCIRLGNTLSEENIIACTKHMCPIRVHWHVKNNYVTHWRVKLTISNYNYRSNYSNWNVLLQHPAFSQNTTSYSFNTAKLPLAFQDGVSLFWGIDYYNTELVHSGKDQQGFVSTEILLEKDPKSFTLSNGWAFPRRVYFNGENCEMPLPDTFPMLPNHTNTLRPPNIILLIISLFCFWTKASFHFQ
ncbi:COBRA-like protein 1 [Arachis stenosperma]|uniref:COBRA-like protein 1 n=1 Tax=Arachis stenosperma TaxID=217475 RepID=UPI0025AC1D6A|nr:COBRA-like protein 1 [Arachis stenosperma]